MFTRIAGTLALLLIATTVVTGQRLSVPTIGDTSAGDWKPSLERPPAAASQSAAAPQFNPGQADTPAVANRSEPVETTNAVNTTPDTSAPITKMVKGSGVLPNEEGQVWREYDISPYTSRVTNTENPQQAIVDWILRETGTEVWFSEPFGILNATKTKLRVYHTPEMQRLVLDIVDRFVASQAESYALSLRLISVGSPNWRTTAMPLLQPINVKSAGVDAWLLTKENAAILINQLSKRTDYRENNSPNIMIQNGQSHTLTRITPRNFLKSVRMRPNAWPGHELEMGQLQEGYSLQLSPLMSLDNNTIDAVIKCHIDQIEKLVPVSVDVPSMAGGTQRVQIQVPQVVSWRLHERFRWPANQVLLLGCGVVASPTAEKIGPLGLPIPEIPYINDGAGRADALLFIENKGKADQALMQANQQNGSGQPSYQGRY
jgi:hypothetical protein